MNSGDNMLEMYIVLFGLVSSLENLDACVCRSGLP